jgi:DNA-directed RNA polymerase I subunit RPA1
LEICKTKFSLLKRGRLQEALELDDTLAHATHRAKGSNQQQQQQDIELALDQVLIEKNDSNPHHHHAPPNDEFHEETSYERSMKRNLVKQVLSMCMGSKKCNHCGAFSPKIRQDSSNKIFQAAISHASARQNLANGIVIQSALGGNMETSQVDGYNSDDTVETNEEDLELGGEDEDVAEGTGDKYMHALEVEAQIKWTWQLEPFLCDSLFGGGVEGHKIFSLRAIPIPPARFRPPMTLGTMTVEHAQNAHLNKMLVSNDRIRSLLMEEDNPKSQAMAYSVWIDLQTTVNCFMDSSKDPSAASSTIQSGIRQILEKKEGIFRKYVHTCLT